MNNMNKISNPVDTDDALNDTWSTVEQMNYDAQERHQEVEDFYRDPSEAEKRSAEISAAQAEIQKAREYLEQKPELKSKMVNALSELQQIELVLNDSSTSDEEKQNKIKESEQFINSVKTFNKAAETNANLRKQYDDFIAQERELEKSGASDEEVAAAEAKIREVEKQLYNDEGKDVKIAGEKGQELDAKAVEKQLNAEKDAAVKDALDSFNEDIGIARQDLAEARAKKAQLEVEYSEKEKSGQTTDEEMKGIEDQIHGLEELVDERQDDIKRLTQRYKDDLGKIDEEFAEKSKNLKSDTEKGDSEKSNETNGENGEKTDSKKKEDDSSEDNETSKGEEKDSKKSESDDVEEKLQKERADDVNKILNEKGEKKEEQKETTFDEFFKNRWNDEKKREEYLPRLENENDRDYENRFKMKCYNDFDERSGHKSNFDEYDDNIEFGPGEDGEEDDGGSEKEKKRNIFGRLKDFFASKFGRSKEGAKNALFTPAEEQERRHNFRKKLFLIALYSTLLGSTFGNFANRAKAPKQQKNQIEFTKESNSEDDADVDDILNEASKQSLNVDLNKEVGAETVDDIVEGTTYGEKVDFNIDAGEWDGESSYFSSEKHGENDLTAPIYNMESTGSKAEISKDMVEGFANNLDDPVQQAEFAALGGTDVKIGNANGISSLEDMNDVFNMAQSDDEFRQELANYSKDQLRDLIEQNDIQHSTVEKGTVYSSLYALNTAGEGEQARLKYFVDDEVTAKEKFEVLQFINDNGVNALDTNEIGGYKYNFLKSVGVIPEDASDDEAKDIMKHKKILGISGKCGQIIWTNISDNPDTGHETTGDEPTGHENSGNESTGHENTGEESTGHEDTGNESTGQEDTGNESTGNESTGHEDTGNESTGQETGNETGGETTGEETGIETGNEDTGEETGVETGVETTGEETGIETGVEGTGDEELAPKTNVFPSDIDNSGVNVINSTTPIENEENNNGIGDSVAGEENGQGNSGIAGVETGSQNEKDTFKQSIDSENDKDIQSTYSEDSSGHNQGNTASTESSSETQDVSTKTEDVSNPDSDPSQNQTNMDDAENEAANRLG